MYCSDGIAASLRRNSRETEAKLDGINTVHANKSIYSLMGKKFERTSYELSIWRKEREA